MKSDVKFRDNSHRARWGTAAQKASAVKENGRVETDFAASLYILTADPDLYRSAEEYIYYGWIDFERMLNDLRLSGGETILVALAGNLYNGGFFNERNLTPLDMVTRLDAECVETVIQALTMRKQTTYIT